MEYTISGGWPVKGGDMGVHHDYSELRIRLIRTTLRGQPVLNSSLFVAGTSAENGAPDLIWAYGRVGAGAVIKITLVFSLLYYIYYIILYYIILYYIILYYIILDRKSVV